MSPKLSGHRTHSVTTQTDHVPRHAPPREAFIGLLPQATAQLDPIPAEKRATVDAVPTCHDERGAWSSWWLDADGWVPPLLIGPEEKPTFQP